MPNYLRYYQPGGTYFFTVVTNNRQPILTTPSARKILGEVFRNAISRYPFTMDAICLLPDHIHCIWTLPENDGNFSIRWSYIKANFSHKMNELNTTQISVSDSREHRRESGFWQRRFWEHLIQDEADYENHIDYIHYNPVKHGLVDEMEDWEWSSFHRYIRMGWYSNEDKDFGNGISLNGSDKWD